MHAVTLVAPARGGGHFDDVHFDDVHSDDVRSRLLERVASSSTARHCVSAQTCKRKGSALHLCLRDLPASSSSTMTASGSTGRSSCWLRLGMTAAAAARSTKP